MNFGIEFGDMKRPQSMGYMSFDYWDIDPNEYNFYKEKDNLDRRLGLQPIEFLEGKRAESIGKNFINYNGSYVECVEYEYSKGGLYSAIITKHPNEEIKRYLKQSTYDNFQNHLIKSPFDISILNTGYYDYGMYDRKDYALFYSYYKSMMVRGYDDKYKLKKPSYKDVTVDIEWFSFQTFCKWCINNYYTFPGEVMNLDKDILYKGNKTYSSNTAVFVPQYINSLFIRNCSTRGELPIGVSYKNNRYLSSCSIINTNGIRERKNLGSFDTSEEAFYVYKRYKEAYIKRVADFYMYKKGGINIHQFKKVYNAMYNYQVEITD